MKTFAPLFLLTGVKYYLFAPTHLTLAKKKFRNPQYLEMGMPMFTKI